jgi:hypothetical protein
MVFPPLLPVALATFSAAERANLHKRSLHTETPALVRWQNFFVPVEPNRLCSKVSVVEITDDAARSVWCQFVLQRFSRV